MSTQLRAVAPPTESPDWSEASPIRVVLADEHTIVRRSMRALLEQEREIEVVAEAGALAATLERVRELAPDVLVLELRLRNGSSMQAIGELRERASDTRVVVVTVEDNPLYAEHAFAAGALGFVRKEHADLELPAAVHSAMRGERFISASVAAKLASYRTVRLDGALSARELEVLRLVALGHTNAEVARILEISPRTVESHRARVHAKLGIKTRAELVRYALRRGLMGV
jgi:two-component system, NarL family, response regulator NreC